MRRLLLCLGDICPERDLSVTQPMAHSQALPHPFLPFSPWCLARTRNQDVRACGQPQPWFPTAHSHVHTHSQTPRHRNTPHAHRHTRSLTHIWIWPQPGPGSWAAVDPATGEGRAGRPGRSDVPGLSLVWPRPSKTRCLHAARFQLQLPRSPSNQVFKELRYLCFTLL